MTPLYEANKEQYADYLVIDMDGNVSNDGGLDLSKPNIKQEVEWIIHFYMEFNTYEGAEVLKELIDRKHRANL